MRKLFALGLCLAIVAPAWAGPYAFVADPAASNTLLRFQGSPKYTWGVAPMVGTFNMQLQGSSPSWNGAATIFDVDVVNTSTLIFGFGAQQGTFEPGHLRLTDAGGTTLGTLAGGPPVASGAWYETLTIVAEGTMPALATAGNPTGYFTLNSVIGPLPFYNVMVADDNNLGMTPPGTPEALLNAYGVYPVEAGGTTAFLDVYINLGGAAPEPGTASLLALAGLALIRRRRA